MRSKEANETQEKANADLRAVLDTPAGRRFIWQLIDDTSLSFDSANPLVTAYREGARGLRLELQQRCKATATELYKAMVREQLSTLELPVDSPSED